MTHGRRGRYGGALDLCVFLCSLSVCLKVGVHLYSIHFVFFFLHPCDVRVLCCVSTMNTAKSRRWLEPDYTC